VGRAARWQEQRALAADLRASGVGMPDIATTLRDRYGVNARVAMRTAAGWSQAEVAGAWTRRWPDDPKTFKNISTWELWPAPTGYAPSLAVLDRLAQLYGCSVADLVAGWGDHGTREPEAAAEERALAWQVTHLDLHELARAMADWSNHLPGRHRHASLLKLAAAVSMAAGGATRPLRSTSAVAVGTSVLAGRWESSYGYRSTSRNAEFTDEHVVDLKVVEGRLAGRSVGHPMGSELELVLDVDGSLVSGQWTERTSPVGHYRSAIFHGLVQFVVDPTGTAMDGRWLGVGKRYTINSGSWRLRRSTASPVTTATTVVPGEISPSAISAKSANMSLPT
jgi:hypothetical protein